MHSTTRRGVVFVHPGDRPSPPLGHEALTHANVARQLATLKEYEFGGMFEPGSQSDIPNYLVPSQTLTIAQARDVFSLRDERDLFGGVVPQPFVATKTITHSLPHSGSSAPYGWSDEFPGRVARVVLPGHSAFSVDDALLGGLRLLDRGTVRVKLADGIGGASQWVIDDAGDLEARLRSIDVDAIARGVVLERNLDEVTTLSVGRVRVGDLVASYYGTQSEVVNNHGHLVYGGSQLTVARGDWDALMGLDLPRAVRIGCEQALFYDAAAAVCFGGSYMSRRNYDVAQGMDADGKWHSGVLEQSWRVGGVSGAELAALHAFRADPSLDLVRASTHEVYGDRVSVPEGATIYYQGVDERVGALTKYAQVL